jgi:hypothetical protein
MTRIGPTMSESERGLRAVLALHVHDEGECSLCSGMRAVAWPCLTVRTVAEATGLDADVLASWASRVGR